jgi:hypothetical protein
MEIFVRILVLSLTPLLHTTFVGFSSIDGTCISSLL